MNYLILLYILYFQESLIQILETKSWIKFTYMVLWSMDLENWNSIIWIVVLNWKIGTLLYGILELYCMDFCYHSKKHLSFYVISYHVSQINNFQKMCCKFLLFYSVLVFDLVQFIVSCWLDYVKTNLVWFGFDV